MLFNNRMRRVKKFFNTEACARTVAVGRGPPTPPQPSPPPPSYSMTELAMKASRGVWVFVGSQLVQRTHKWRANEYENWKLKEKKNENRIANLNGSSTFHDAHIAHDQLSDLNFKLDLNVCRLHFRLMCAMQCSRATLSAALAIYAIFEWTFTWSGWLGFGRGAEELQCIYMHFPSHPRRQRSTTMRMRAQNGHKVSWNKKI